MRSHVLMNTVLKSAARNNNAIDAKIINWRVAAQA
jgi:hypothetical protein